MITNGTVKYGETVKTGDYENKRVDVELSFTLAEDEDADLAIAVVGSSARHQAGLMLTGCKTAPKANAAQAIVEEVVKTTKAPKAPKAPVKATDASAVDEPMETPAFLKGKMLDPATGKPAAEVADPAAVEDDGLGDLLGTGAKEITDKELTDATQKCQSANKNSPAIRLALKTVGVVSPPGRIIDIPQDKRQEYLNELLKIKPLA